MLNVSVVVVVVVFVGKIRLVYFGNDGYFVGRRDVIWKLKKSVTRCF